MRDRLTARVAALLGRLHGLERRELGEFRRWAENTNNLVHLSVLLCVPLVIGLVTFLTNAVAELSFLLFPPLASGTYTLFADPEGKYASVRKFVGGLTAGAACGWVALAATRRVDARQPRGDGRGGRRDAGCPVGRGRLHRRQRRRLRPRGPRVEPGRSKASRFVSPPTFERLHDVETDVVVVDRGGVS